MRLSKILFGNGKCLRISYLPDKDDIIPDIEHFSAGVISGRKKIHISSLGADFTFAQIRRIARTMLQIVEDNK